MNATAVTDRLVFLRNFLRDWREIGSVTPSSRFLVRAMLGHIDFDGTRRIVEYGPGTGVFTRELLARMHAECQLLTLDTVEEFNAVLRSRLPDPRLVVVTGSASAIVRHVAALGWPHVDAVVSGIPYTAMPRTVRQAILAASAEALSPSGKFLAYQYSPVIVPLLRAYFGSVRVRWNPLNIPPAFYFVCGKRSATLEAASR